MTRDDRDLATLTRHIHGTDIVGMAVHLLRGPFTVDAYQRLGELGVLRQDDRVELIDGQVVTMTPIGDRHAACVRRVLRLLTTNLRGAAVIDVQDPVVLGTHDAPQPDLVVLKPRPDAYPHHPRAPDILLIIEVADTTLAYDRDIKIPRYARAGIPEAWLVDLAADRIEVYREPAGEEYASARSVSRGDMLTPLTFPDMTVTADEILG
jgi:Uma2 family endonuclease